MKSNDPLNLLKVMEAQVFALQHTFEISGKNPNLVIFRNRAKELEALLKKRSESG